MPAQNREELLVLFEKEFAALTRTLETVDDALAQRPDPVDGISIKDTIAHRAHWIGLFLGWYADGKAGRAVEIPAPGVKWNQLKAYNARVRADSRALGWQTVLAGFRESHDRLTGLVGSLDDDELYGAHVYAWTKDWTVGRYAEASGPSHYRSANKYIRKLKRTMAAA